MGEKYRLKVSENILRRETFTAKRDEVIGEWRRLHNAELYDLYFSHNFVRVIKTTTVRLVWHVAYMGNRTGVYRVLVRRSERKRPHRTAKRRWEDNIKTDLQEVGCRVMIWIELAQCMERWRALVMAVMNLRVP
jgi:hypothetical protein